MSTGRLTHYEIRDVDGGLVAVHCREGGPEGSRMWWTRPDGTLGLGGIATADLPLYGVHHLNDHPAGRVILVEGEKAADYLNNVGILAVGTVTGAGGTPSGDSLKPLTGRDVLLWPDADDPGYAHMERIAPLLIQLGVSPRVLEWPDAPPGGDAADFIDLHGEGVAVERVLAGARPWEPSRLDLPALQALVLNATTIAPPEEAPATRDDHAI